MHMKQIPLFKVGMNPDAHLRVQEVLTPNENGVIYCGEGPLVKQFENEFFNLVKSKTKPLMMNSCTSAITLALTLCDVEPGSEVISVAQTCFSYNTRISLADGTNTTIGKIVNQKINCEVLTRNILTQEIEIKKVTDWIKVPAKNVTWYKLSLKNSKKWSKNKHYTQNGVWITGDHKVLTNRGYCRVDQLTVDHKISTSYDQLNNLQSEAFNGMMLGDGSITGESRNSFRFTTTHTDNHKEYIWLTQSSFMLPSNILINMARKRTKTSSTYLSKASPFWKQQRNRWYNSNGKKIVPDDLILSDMTLATWFMDDGNYSLNDVTRRVIFCTDNFESNDFWKLFYKLVDIGFKPHAVKCGPGRSGYRISLGENNNDVDKLFKKISKYILPCFRYKIPNGYDEFDKNSWNLGQTIPFYDDYELIQSSLPKTHKPSYAYCLEVEDNHNFVIGNMVVSNCLATNHPILAHFATPVWADINPHTGLIDVEDVKNKITDKTKAIIAVDWSGQYCDYNALKSYGIPVIQDAAHCLFIDPNNCGDYICWSTQAIKFLTTADGGFLSVPEEKYTEARLRRWFSLDREASADFRCAQNAQYVGFKFQATDIDAAIGLSNIPVAVENQKKHQLNAKYYDENIRNPLIIKPKYTSENQWWLYTLLIPDRRDEFCRYLSDHNIASSQVHSRNDHHDVFKDYMIDLPGTDYFSKNQLSIPVGWWLTEEDRQYIVETINAWN